MLLCSCSWDMFGSLESTKERKRNAKKNDFLIFRYHGKGEKKSIRENGGNIHPHFSSRKDEDSL